MFEEFSSGYYLGRMYVEPYEGESAAMHTDEYEMVSEHIYSEYFSDSGTEEKETEGSEIEEEKREYPLVMKVDKQHFTVQGEAGIPSHTLAIPSGFVDKSSIRNPPALKEVLLAKPEYASHLLRLTSEV